MIEATEAALLARDYEAAQAMARRLAAARRAFLAAAVTDVALESL